MPEQKPLSAKALEEIRFDIANTKPSSSLQGLFRQHCKDLLVGNAALREQLAHAQDHAAACEHQSTERGNRVIEIERRCVELQSQLAQVTQERDRLLRGAFTDDELQGFCHNLDENDRRAFFDGCTKYQERLFGTSAVWESRKGPAK